MAAIRIYEIWKRATKTVAGDRQAIGGVFVPRRSGRPALIVALVLSLVLGGCWDRIEVNDLAIVQGVALDRASEGMIEVTVSIAVPARITPPGATGGGDQTGPPATNKSATGRTVSEAFNSLQNNLSRRLFWAHNALILIGEDLAREGIAGVLDFYMRNRQPRLNTTLAVTTGRAKDVLAATLPIELNVPIGILEIERLQVAPVVDLLGFARLLHSEGVEPVTGLIHVVTGGAPEPGTLQTPDDPASDPSQPAVFGAAVFRGDRMVGLLSEEEARGLLLIRGELGMVFVIVPIGDEGWIGVALIRHKSRVVPKVQDGQIAIVLEISLHTDLQDNAVGVDTNDDGVIKIIEEELARVIERKLRRTLDKLQRELGVDVFGFGAAIKRNMPQVWRQIQDFWDDLYPTVPVDIRIDASILRTGLTNMPQAHRDNRVIDAGRLRQILRGD